MQERCSELRLIWVVVILVGAQAMGVDITIILQVVLAILGTGCVDQAAATVADAGHTGGAGNITLPLLAGAYAWVRSDIKKQRESLGPAADKERVDG